MRRRAKTQIAGILAAIPLSVLFCGAATSQVINRQVQLGDVFTEQTMDVVDVTDVIGVTSVAMGSGASAGSAVGGAISVDSQQELQGRVQATTVLNAAGTMGQSAVLSISATGNSLDTSMQGGPLTAMASQYAGPAGVLARGQTEAEEGGAVAFSDTTQAVNNSFDMSLTNATAGVRLSQTTDGGALADGGAIMGEATGDSLINSQTVGNNANMDGANSAFRTVVDQTNHGDVVQASKFAAYGSSNVSTTAANASANNLHANNQGGLADVRNSQTNTAYVRAQAEETSASFSAATANAYGVGNSMLAGSAGPEVIIYNEQVNSDGGVEAIATFEGGSGYDAAASATAMGNAATGYACSECNSSLKADNYQTNSADVSATTRTSIGGSSRAAIGSAAAVGNNASYYVSAPTNRAQ